jgi:hypothetical protein
MLEDLSMRGLKLSRSRIFIVDGRQGTYAALRKAYGKRTLARDRKAPPEQPGRRSPSAGSRKASTSRSPSSAEPPVRAHAFPCDDEPNREHERSDPRDLSASEATAR